ncbi:MAG TPA: alpha/beta hydrolase [Actinomycetota bacterium]|nr:alpha/beta hydrolase [Actinomycetota bacterium]
MTSFPAAGFRAIRYDVRGYGASSRQDGRPYSEVADLVALLDELGVDQAALVGCSMGGAIAIDTTLEHPDRVWALVPTASAIGGVEASQEEEDWFADVVAPIEDAIEAGDHERARALELERLWAPLGTEGDAGRRIREIAFDNLHELTMDETLPLPIDPPAGHRLHEIDVPTLVLKAEHDPPFSRRLSDVIAAGIAGARESLIEGADHVVNLRQPERFDAAVIAFLREVAPEADAPIDR